MNNIQLFALGIMNRATGYGDNGGVTDEINIELIQSPGVWDIVVIILTYAIYGVLIWAFITWFRNRDEGGGLRVVAKHFKGLAILVLLWALLSDESLLFLLIDGWIWCFKTILAIFQLAPFPAPDLARL